LTKQNHHRLAGIDDSAWFWRPLSDYAAIEPVFSGGVYRLFSANNRNGTRNPISVKIMLGASIISRVRATVRRFIRAKDGNIAFTFAIAAIPIISFVGAAIDYTRVNRARSSMQAALDSTALMLAKDLTDGIITKDDIDTKAQSYFSALYTNPDTKADPVKAKYTLGTTSAGSTVEVTGSGAVSTDFLKVAGVPNLNFSSSSTSTWGSSRMRVAMVLDNTGSMADNDKMEEMQKAARSMIDTLKGYKKQTGDVYISIIPFAKDVNVGTSNIDQTWINWSEWEGEPPFLVNNKPSGWNTINADSDCPFTDRNHGFTCMDRPATISGAKSTSKIPSTGTYAGYICPSIDSGRKIDGKTGIYYNGCYTTTTGSSASCGTSSSCTCSGSGSSKICHAWRGDGTPATQAAATPRTTWTGCVNDRDQSNDTTKIAPTSPSTLFYAEQWRDCLPAKVQGMSEDFDGLKDQITAMSPSGNTNQAVGIAWGWLSLSTQDPPLKAPAKDDKYVYKNYIVVLSDGLNTQNRWGTSQTDIDARQKILCQNIKDDKLDPVTVFTIQVNINNRDAKSKVLEDCATPAPNGSFQMITAPGQTSQAFENILAQISRLRVAK
jgi:Flp pilus assembly protein TadG